ncbi:FAD-dependent oxidoreductase [Paenibacillus larvae]|nr:FAD-dependent oxidoreductase [Paenibacillus larvae]
MSAQVDAIIVGGGVIGCSAAYYLSLKGLKVMLLEKGRIGQEASGAAAGMLGAQSELTEDGPLWKLARCSRDLFPRLAEELRELSGIDIALVQRGMLKVAVTEQDAAELKRLLDLQQQAGEGLCLRSRKPLLRSTVASLLARARELVPALEEAEWERAWSGLRPQTPDGLPYIGPAAEYPGLYVAAGHFRNGILLSPVTGRYIAGLIVEEHTGRTLSSGPISARTAGQGT